MRQRQQVWRGIGVHGEGLRDRGLAHTVPTPRANAVCERFLGSVRRESLDHLLIVTDGQLYRMIKEYVALFNLARPQQGSAEQIPERMGIEREEKREGKILYFPVLNGLHHDYRRAA